MANLFPPSIVRWTDANGDPLNGAKMYFYTTETSTPLDAYTDGDGLVPAANPEVSDSAGVFAGGTGIFLDAAATYRIKLTNSSGSITYFDTDPVRGSDATSITLSGLTMTTNRFLGRTTAGTGAVEENTFSAAFNFASNALSINDGIIIACSDETTAITTGTAKRTFRMPFAATLTAVRASAVTAPTGSTLIIDINESGTTVLSTKLTLDAGEKTSTTAATPAVISDSALADDAEISIDFDQVGSSVAGAGVKVALYWRRA